MICDDCLMDTTERWTPTECSQSIDGDQIYSPAHVAIDGHLLIGVTDLQLRPAEPASIQGTAVRPIPQSLTVLRPLPTAAEGPPPESTRVIAVPADPADFAAPGEPAADGRQVPSLAVAESEPEYVPASALEDRQADAGALLGLLDTHTKGKARGAPIGLFVLAALAVILFLALR